MGPTTALGTQPVSLLELTNAYGVFATGGRHVSPRSILEITFPNGQPPYIAPKPQLQAAISPQAAYMMTSILTDAAARVPDFNTANPLEFNESPNEGGWTPADNLNFPAIAAKTGTSQGNIGPRDIITMGYSPYMALGIWAGNNDNTDIKPGVIGIAGAGYIFHDIMQYAIGHYKWPKGVEFPMPSGLGLGTFNCSSGLAPYKDVPNPGSCPDDNVPGFGNSTNVYGGHQNAAASKGYPDTDWYIKDLPWLQS
jgi:membrane peptidoglycan carboxypeptidase